MGTLVAGLFGSDDFGVSAGELFEPGVDVGEDAATLTDIRRVDMQRTIARMRESFERCRR